MQVQEDVRQHHQHAVAGGVRHAVPEDRLPDLRLGDVVPGALDERLGLRCGGHGPPRGSSVAARPSGTNPGYPTRPVPAGT